MSTPASPRLDRRKLRELVERAVEGTGADLEDLVEQRAGARRLLRIAVDRDGGVTSDDLADVSHALSAALDASDVMGEAPYVLEVTSPGVDRPLTLPRHWRRNTGRLVKAALAEGGEMTGRVAAADDDGVDLLVGDAGEPVRLAYAAVARAKVQVEFNRADSADEDGDFADDGSAGDGADAAGDAGFDDTSGRGGGADESLS
jgi:ribosome maturation factor RimP